ncbi:platelet-activating factor acetylhydrolase, isoform II-domain-containing protein [Apodospora peruviana]|uniref:Putative phospholipase n=1 Tax=Apodospora peruviana TaxID=516989 RepID=A0AAE0II58_9PEZI|nr:platelet-activating factor acetylhydrolase, isoform II-domain-containing protein [Apodospora peruviana]
MVNKMASMLSLLNPIPAFPEYTGPYKVGSIDVEIPISELTAPSPAPGGAQDLVTAQCRIFYPATPDSDGKRITWLPAPQRLHLSFYTQFLGLGSLAASVLSFLPRHLHYITIPVHKNAKLLQPQLQPESESESDSQPQHKRWPTVVFSHGLGGSRNAYSHLAGSLASHGVVVVCPEHRDGSAIVSLVRDPNNRDHHKNTNARAIPCIRIPHTNTPEVWGKRDKQMRIRLWELGLNLEAIIGIDCGDERIVKSNLNTSTPEHALAQFRGMLDVQEPGKVIFGGHSFGAATMVQLLKSTYYAEKLSKMSNPLFSPNQNSAIARQVTERSPTFLLDMWCFPLLSAASAPLYNLPLPAYANRNTAPGGSAILAVESETFYKWKDHLHVKARILSPDPSQIVVSKAAFQRPNGTEPFEQPNFFYVENSAHLSQSDFGVLFPWFVKKAFGAEQPERTMRLNVRALLQFLRGNGVGSWLVAGTWVGDLVEGGGGDVGKDKRTHDDGAILATDDKTAIESWKRIDIVGLGAHAGPSELELLVGKVSKADASKADQGEREMEEEIEPGVGHEDDEKKMHGGESSADESVSGTSTSNGIGAAKAAAAAAAAKESAVSARAA